MEKDNHLPLSGQYGAIAPRDEKRRSIAPESRVVRSVVFVIIICLGLARIFGVFEPKENVPLTIVERAKIILKENPLIGQSGCARA